MTHQQREQIDAMFRSVQVPGGRQTIEEQRAVYAAIMGRMHVPQDVRVSQTKLAGLRTLLVEPLRESRSGTILFFHGGSWVVGSPETEMCLTASLVSRTGYRALSVDYRLAPEHPFPAGIEDAFAAYQALVSPRAKTRLQLRLPVIPPAVAFFFTTLIKAKRAGLPMPAALVAFSPGLDATRTGKSMDSKAGIDPIISRESLKPFQALYLSGADPHQELLSPATMTDPTGFPPLLIQVGTNEVLRRFHPHGGTRPPCGR